MPHSSLGDSRNAKSGRAAGATDRHLRGFETTDSSSRWLGELISMRALPGVFRRAIVGYVESRFVKTSFPWAEHLSNAIRSNSDFWDVSRES